MTYGGVLRAGWRTSGGRECMREVCPIRGQERVTCWECVKFCGEKLWEGGIQGRIPRKGGERDSTALAVDPEYFL